MPLVGDQLYFDKEFVALCIVIVIFELLLIHSIWYLCCIMKFRWSVFQITSILNDLSITSSVEVCSDDIFIAKKMHKDMELIHIIQHNIQMDIASIILSFLLETTMYGTRPRKDAIWGFTT